MPAQQHNNDRERMTVFHGVLLRNIQISVGSPEGKGVGGVARADNSDVVHIRQGLQSRFNLHRKGERSKEAKRKRRRESVCCIPARKYCCVLYVFLPSFRSEVNEELGQRFSYHNYVQT